MMQKISGEETVLKCGSQQPHAVKPPGVEAARAQGSSGPKICFFRERAMYIWSMDGSLIFDDVSDWTHNLMFGHSIP